MKPNTPAVRFTGSRTGFPHVRLPNTPIYAIISFLHLAGNTMKTEIDVKSLLKKVLALGGFHAFLFTLDMTRPSMLLTIGIMTVVLWVKLVRKQDHMELMFPLASGLFIFVMRLFYWDKPDFIHRVEILLHISLLFILVLTVRKFRLAKRFLYNFNRLHLKKRLIVIFVAAEILFIAASFIIVDRGVKWGGDEPHYLVISHSIARDFDLNVFDQYARDRYREFVEVPLKHHARVGKGFKVWYSYGHLPGLSLTLAPFFLIQLPVPVLYVLIRAYLGLFGALLAVVVYLFALRLWNNKSLAIFITLALTLTAPVFFYSIHIFAELQAALLILSSLYLLLYHEKKTLLAGFLLGISVFWGLKYAIFIYMFCGLFFLYFVIKKHPKRAIMFVVFPVLFQVLFFGYLYYAYGSLDPMSIYNGIMTEEQVKVYKSNMQKIPLLKRVETLFGIFFDQRDGLLLYSPFYFLAFPGLILALKKYRQYWRHLLIASAGIAFILFLGYSTVRAGYCPQARYLSPVVWVLMLFAVIYYKETRNKRVKQWFFYLPVYGLLVSLYQVLHPFTLYQSATHANLNRPGLMFQHWSNIHVDLAGFLPSFVKVPGNFSYVPNILFLILFVGVIFFSLMKVEAVGKRFVMPVIFSVLFIFGALLPGVPTYNPVVLGKEGAKGCKIYGKSPYPTRTTERKFDLKETQEYSYTISTHKAAPYFVLEFENHGHTDYTAAISNFDRQLQTARIVPGTEARPVTRITVKSPLYKRFKNQFFYRFHIAVAPPPPARPALYLQIYPVKVP